MSQAKALRIEEHAEPSSPEGWELGGPTCVLRFADEDGQEQTVTLRPGESVAEVLRRENLSRGHGRSRSHE